MGFKRNTISDEEHKERSFKLFDKGGTENLDDLHEIFFLYNDRMEPRKQDKHCGSCRAYVWKRLKEYYNQ